MHQIYLSAGKALGCESCRMPQGAKPSLEEMGNGLRRRRHFDSRFLPGAPRANTQECSHAQTRMRQAAKHRVSVAI